MSTHSQPCFFSPSDTGSLLETSALPDFTDWFHVSPMPHVDPLAPQYSLQPFREMLASSRINALADSDLCLNYVYDLAELLRDENTSSASKGIGSIQTSIAPTAIFNSHHRMLSMDSTTTLINSPSPSTFGILSPTGTAFEYLFSSSASNPASPASKLVQDLQSSGTAFGSSFDSTAAAFPTELISDISPVVRAEKLQDSVLAQNKQAAKTKKSKKRNKRTQPSSFVQKLRAAPPPQRIVTPVVSVTSPQTLLSPCRLAPSSFDEPLGVTVDNTPTPDLPTSPQVSSSSPRFGLSTHFSSPLTPLTPLSSSPDQPPRLTITLKVKRKIADPEPSTPLRRSKRPRRSHLLETSSSLEDEPCRSRTLSPAFTPPNTNNLLSVYTTRNLPDWIEISPNYPLFYRRFPASSYLQLEESDSPCALFDVRHPGGVYNPPRNNLDLYTPRFVKGKGVEKVGLCPICVEPHDRGGENKKLWLAMKFSAFNYHMQYAHGIAASSGRPFSPPTAFRVVPRPNPGKKEKHRIQQGKCHKCAQWVAVEGIKDMESKVKELHWWKHAAACHQDSVLAGDEGYFEDDRVFQKLVLLASDSA
ncbi:hypothetical protein B0H34DRAFT_724751 [Crassisporium funariophilum]|nr:hypothetical protein B0H34DRAFT_724751 [Crassisporium funariophilum]